MFGRASRTSSKKAPHDVTKQSPLPRDYRKLFLRIVIGLLLVILATTAVLLLVFLQLSGREIEKNIVVINQNFGGYIDNIIFASISKGQQRIEVVDIAVPVTLVPQSQVITEQVFLDHQQRAQLSLQLGVPIDEIWEVEQMPEQVSKNELWQIWLHQINLHLTPTDQIYFSQMLDLASAHLTMRDATVTAHQVTQINPKELAALQLARPVEEQARACSIALVNSTSKSGVATALTQLWEGLGLVIVRVTDSSEQLSTSYAVRQPQAENCQQVIAIVERMTPQALEVKVDPEVTNQYRASLVFFIGEDIAKLKENWTE